MLTRSVCCAVRLLDGVAFDVDVDMLRFFVANASN